MGSNTRAELWQVQITSIFEASGDLSHGAILQVSTRTIVFDELSKARACLAAEQAAAIRTRDWPGASCEVVLTKLAEVAS